jgi:hypothetical protein
MSEDCKLACMHCRVPLAFIHGHYACLNAWCQLYGVNVIPCCQP